MSALPEHCEVVIIGGGFAGAATAYALTRAGIRDVLLVERESTCGYHASGRNAALGRQLVGDDQITELTLRGAAFLREPPDGFASEPLLQVTGSLITSRDPARLDLMLRRARQRDLPAHRLDADAVAARWPRLAGVTPAGGVLFPTDGVIDIHALLQGFLAGARRRGATIAVRCEVTGFVPGSPVTVVTGRGAVTARCVVIAGGAWAGTLGEAAGAREVDYAPMRRHLFLTEKTPDAADPAPFVWNLGADDEFYARPEAGGFLLSGCDGLKMAPCDARPEPTAVADLAAKLGRVAPGFAELGIARTWACLRTFTPDGRPVIDWDPELPWLFWVAGLGGHGATASAAVGESAANRIAARISPRYA